MTTTSEFDQFSRLLRLAKSREQRRRLPSRDFKNNVVFSAGLDKIAESDSLPPPCTADADGLVRQRNFVAVSHRLQPPEGHAYLDPEKVVQRLREEFAYCVADADQGADDVGDIIAKLIDLQAPQAMIDEAMAGRERSFRITIADDMTSEDYLSFILQPGTGPLIGYYSAQHEAATRPLLERCARVVGYEIILV